MTKGVFAAASISRLKPSKCLVVLFGGRLYIFTPQAGCSIDCMIIICQYLIGAQPSRDY